tara:strand:+ start:2389 stop:2712 length:324 start_codon:yes stop_codon:yes gene_type:complete
MFAALLRLSFKNREALMSGGMISRIGSVIVVLTYLVVALQSSGLDVSLISVVLYLVLLLCIWLPDVMGDLAFAKAIPLNHTPDGLIVFGGWILLLLPALLSFFSNSP